MIDTTKLTFEANMALNPDFASLRLAGQATGGVFPRWEAVIVDKEEKFIHLDLNAYWRGPDGIEPDPFAEICFEIETQKYSFGLLEYFSPTCHRGELTDPGGWEVREWSDWYEGEEALIAALKQAWDKDLAAQKAEAEAEAADYFAEIEARNLEMDFRFLEKSDGSAL